MTNSVTFRAAHPEIKCEIPEGLTREEMCRHIADLADLNATRGYIPQSVTIQDGSQTKSFQILGFCQSCRTLIVFDPLNESGFRGGLITGQKIVCSRCDKTGGKF